MVRDEVRHEEGETTFDSSESCMMEDIRDGECGVVSCYRKLSNDGRRRKLLPESPLDPCHLGLAYRGSFRRPCDCFQALK